MIGNLLIGLMNLPRLAQRLIAWGLLAAVVCLGLVVGFGAFNQLAAKRNEILENRWALAKLDKLIAQGSSITIGAQEHTDGAASPFLTGDSIPLIQANLQSRLNSIAAIRSASVISVGNAPALTIDGVQYVGVRADLQGSLDALYNTIFELETSAPPLVVREAKIHSVGNPTSSVTGPIELVAQISVYGAIEVTAEDKNLQAANQ